MQVAYESLKKSIVELGFAEQDVAPHKKILSDLQLDSTEVVQIALDIHKAFNVKLAEYLKRDLSVAELADIVQQNQEHV